MVMRHAQAFWPGEFWSELMADNLDDFPGNDIADSVVVTTEQMQQIESALFSAGMPVAALMEKVAGRITSWVTEHYPRDRAPQVGVMIGPGNNGGDAAVVARELHHRGYRILLWYPFSKAKELASQHKSYLEYLALDCVDRFDELKDCDLIIDGGFGLGQTRPLEGDFADGVSAINTWDIPVVSIDLPSGISSDTGAVLGSAIRARHTLCLGLWKVGLLQDSALPWIGEAHLIPFDVPPRAIDAILPGQCSWHRLTATLALNQLPLPRAATAHKYKTGHALLIAGSHRYVGAVLLMGKGAIASGVGMVTIVVPESLKMAIASQLPEALTVAAPESEEGVIASLPDSLELAKYDVVACGPGLTTQVHHLMEAVIQCDRPLVLDADGLNWLSQGDPVRQLKYRTAPTLLTPHPGEFRRLFAERWEHAETPGEAARQAAQATSCTIILKGAMSAIANYNGRLWINAKSTPALARGGSGDVLTGLIAGLAAQHCQSDPHHPDNLVAAALSAVWWHAQTGLFIAAERTSLGCSASHLADMLLPVLAHKMSNAGKN